MRARATNTTIFAARHHGMGFASLDEKRYTMRFGRAIVNTDALSGLEAMARRYMLCQLRLTQSERDSREPRDRTPRAGDDLDPRAASDQPLPQYAVARSAPT